MKLSVKLGESQFHSDTGEGAADPQADMLIQSTLQQWFQATEKQSQSGGGQQQQRGGGQQQQQQFGGGPSGPSGGGQFGSSFSGHDPGTGAPPQQGQWNQPGAQQHQSR